MRYEPMSCCGEHPVNSSSLSGRSRIVQRRVLPVHVSIRVRVRFDFLPSCLIDKVSIKIRQAAELSPATSLSYLAVESPVTIKLIISVGKACALRLPIYVVHGPEPGVVFFVTLILVDGVMVVWDVAEVHLDDLNIGPWWLNSLLA